MSNMIQNFDYNGQVISRRADGFISLTQMCQANGKRLDVFMKAIKTKDYIEALSNSHQMVVVYTEEGVNGGTWGHPSLAINLARWISPKFAVWCDQHIFNLMTNGHTEIIEQPPVQRELQSHSSVEYAQALIGLEQTPDSLLKQLIKDAMIDELSLNQNLKYLPVAEKPKQYTIVKVRAKQLGYTDEQIGDGKQLGKFVKSQITPSFQEMIGRYPVYHYEINHDLDGVIQSFFN